MVLQATVKKKVMMKNCKKIFPKNVLNSVITLSHFMGLAFVLNVSVQSVQLKS
jgi:hypothetical protein